MSEKKQDIYKIFRHYTESNPEEKQFDEDIQSSLEKFDEKEKSKIVEKIQKIEHEERKLVLEAEKKPTPLWLEILLNILIIGVLFFLVRTFVFVPFNIDGASMEGTLHNGEFIYVDKATPLFRDYERGDVVVFIPPYKKMIKEKFLLCKYHQTKNFVLREGKADPCIVQASFIKRVIGVEGDVVEIKGGHVFVTPKGGKKQEISQQYLLPENKNKTCLSPAWNCQSKKSVNGVKYSPVPAGKVFVLGDNRQHSSDSREPSWETPFVETDNIIGIARAVFLSPPSREERSSGFVGAMGNVLKSFSGDRILHQQPVID